MVREEENIAARRCNLMLFGILAGSHALAAWAFLRSADGDLPLRLLGWNANFAFAVSLGLALIVGALVFRSVQAMDRLLKPALGVSRLQTAFSIYGVLSWVLLVGLKGLLSEDVLPEAAAVGVAMGCMALALAIWAALVRRFRLRPEPDPLS